MSALDDFDAARRRAAEWEPAPCPPPSAERRPQPMLQDDYTPLTGWPRRWQALVDAGAVIDTGRVANTPTSGIGWGP